MSGYISIVLHAHLPYVRRHQSHCLEERWFFEAMTETYIPLLQMMRRLEEDRVRFRFTVSLSPTLLAMMDDDLLKERYSQYLERAIELGEKETERTQKEHRFKDLAYLYLEGVKEVQRTFLDCNRRVIDAYKRFSDAGHIEVITTAATHGYLPLLSVNPSSVRAQVLVGAIEFERIFGSKPPGIWLPECGYYPGLEDVLKETGARYFILERHGLLNAEPRPPHGVFEPVRCPNGVAVFGRDPESANQVWSATDGYPGDYEYREFYRDIGYDLPLEYVGPYVFDNQIRVDTGYKYYRITGCAPEKELYRPAIARERAHQHAHDFVGKRLAQTARMAPNMKNPPVVLAPYDAELFGHWWHEGPVWLEHVAREAAACSGALEMITPSEYLMRHDEFVVRYPCASSWGDKGFHEVWLNGKNDWMWPHIHRAGRRMRKLSERYCGADEPTRSAIEQAARELLMAESSDWPFILNNGTAVEYARTKFGDHIRRFSHLFDALMSGRPEESVVRRMRAENNLFAFIPVDAWR